MKEKQCSINLIDFIRKSVSPFHVVQESIKILENHGFKRLDMRNEWNLENEGAYFTAPYDSALFAFTISKTADSPLNFRIGAAHTDSPCLRIKPVPEMSEKNYLKINTEIYGGAILNTWLDRPLSIAGKVALKSNDIFKPDIKFIDLKKPVITIPNLAIHVNKEVNKGIELNKQKDMIPIAAMINNSLNKDTFFLDYIAQELNVLPENILDFDLYVYNTEMGEIVGLYDDFISSPRLDNITSVLACINGIVNGRRNEGINVAALFDNEEIGSRSKQGADSTLMTIVLEKIAAALGNTRIEFNDAVMRSTLLSVDVSHAYHPNYPEKNDPVNIAQLNNGIVLKIDSSQKYAFDTEAIAIVQQLCKAKNIKYQKFINRSDMPSGSTLGSIASSQLPMKTVDLGIPLLAMHSSRELAGIMDQYYLEKLMTYFFEV